MTATWKPVRDEGDGTFDRGRRTYQVEDLVEDDGTVIARIEDFGYAAYPMALNAKTGNWERGGAYAGIGRRDPVTKEKVEPNDPDAARVRAKLWAERTVGLHPTKPGDERPAFYYQREAAMDEEGEEQKQKPTQVLWENHQWMVTDYGLEDIRNNDSSGYYIEASRLLERGGAGQAELYDWPVHMAAKSWVDAKAFNEAFVKALELHAGRYPGSAEPGRLKATLEASLRTPR